MLRLVWLAGLILCSVWCSFGQLKKFYTLKNSESYDTVDFHLKATATNCLITRGESIVDALTIFGDPTLEKINPSFGNRVRSNTCYASLALDEYESSDFGNSFAMAVSRSDKENDFWRVNFSDKKIYKLDLHYGFGSADVDLTGASVKNLKVNSGSADIAVGFDEGYPNGVVMDTFFVKADFGSISARHMELTRAKRVITKIGFGNVLLDFDKSTTTKCDIAASVGAGNLTVLLPKSDSNIPIIITIKNSPLCAIKLADGFEQVERNTYINMSYAPNAENLLRFDVDVALGMVNFKYAD